VRRCTASLESGMAVTQPHSLHAVVGSSRRRRGHCRDARVATPAAHRCGDLGILSGPPLALNGWTRSAGRDLPRM
jgi:hypothetical protein